jgi:hypothetical protein
LTIPASSFGRLAPLAGARLAVAVFLLAAGQARAQEMFSRDTVHGLIELRAGAAEGEVSWLDGGFGKTSFSEGDPTLGVGQALVEWRPSLGFAVGAVVSGQFQPDLDPQLDLNEAYLKFRAPPSSAGRLSARLGLFYPPVSLEHPGVGWTTQDTLSASALNTWIGEEVKVAGLEATFERSFGSHEISATGAVFGWNDTSGTLLTFRGWALGAVRSGVETQYPLPPLSAFMQPRQAPVTLPFLELDRRAGYYGRLEWRPPAPVSLNVFHYDNAGNRTAVEDLQWAWETRFTNVGVTWEAGERTRVLAQALTGETLMGFSTPVIWADVGFRAAFVLVSRDVGAEVFTGRLDWFDTQDRSWLEADDNNETGWAATAAWRHTLAPHAYLLVEAQHVTSERPSRALALEAPRQNEANLQAALRLTF